MALLPKKNPLESALNDNEITLSNRDYVGMSQLGHNCHRYLQYVHYWAFENTITTRVNRLFGVGHRSEDMMKADLASMGIIVVEDQKQVVGFAGHWKGHIDGIALEKGKDKRLVEFKTHNAKSFKDLQAKGVQVSKPVHYSQMQAYMHYLELKESIYMAYSKNDSTYHIEFIDYDEEWANELVKKSEEIVMSPNLLPRIGTGSSTWFECKFCDARKVCYKKEETLENCRTCSNVHVINDGEWVCGFDDEKPLTADEQREGCGKYRPSIMFKEIE